MGVTACFSIWCLFWFIQIYSVWEDYLIDLVVYSVTPEDMMEEIKHDAEGNNGNIPIEWFMWSDL